MIYTGKVELVHQRHDGRQLGDDAISKGYRWTCSCGAEQKADTFNPDRNLCEDNLDKHLITAHSLAHMRKDPGNAIERPPTRDASHDVRHARPSSQGISEDALDDVLIDAHIIDFTKVAEKHRWSLFTDEQLTYLYESLGTRARADDALMHPMSIELAAEIDRRNITRNKGIG